MISVAFPDPSTCNMDYPCFEEGWPNFINHASASYVHFPEHDGPLSIKCAFQGREIYQANGSRVVVDDSSYLILNDRQRYASCIESEFPVESFCVFFRRGFAEEVLRSLVTPDDRLLDDPRGGRRPAVRFFDTLYRHDRTNFVSPMLFKLRAVSMARQENKAWLTRGWFEEQYHCLVAGLLQAHRNVLKDVERLPAKRLSTRVELYRRLCHARDYIEAHIDSPISLNQIADSACLSPHHFLRLFKHIYGETPHQYLTRRRIERAQRLLTSTDYPVTRICCDLGFESLGSFSWLFRRHVGESPSQFRNQRRGARILLEEMDPFGKT